MVLSERVLKLNGIQYTDLVGRMQLMIIKG